MAHGYVIANVDVTDPVQYEEYKRLSTHAMLAHGAEIIVRGGRSENLEGEFFPRVVVMRFSSFEAAQAFYRSAEYDAARKARTGAGRMNMIAVEGVE